MGENKKHNEWLAQKKERHPFFLSSSLLLQIKTRASDRDKREALKKEQIRRRVTNY